MASRSAPLLFAASLALAACSSKPAASTGGTSSGGTGAGGHGGAADAGPALRVLFIGNSYTYVNDLPGRVHAVAESSGVATVDVDSVVQGGATLQEMTLTSA